MMRLIFRGLCTSATGRNLLAGTIGVLVGVETFMSGRTTPRRSNPARTAKKVDPYLHIRTLSRGVDFLKIYRTKSELGYVYWVLQGFGCYRCFQLLDSWQEAMAEAERRLHGAPVLEEQLVTAESHT